MSKHPRRARALLRLVASNSGETDSTSLIEQLAALEIRPWPKDDVSFLRLRVAGGDHGDDFGCVN